MSVTFSLLNGTNSVALTPVEATRGMQAKKGLYPIPGKHHILVPLGSEGPTFTIAGFIHSSTDYDKMCLWDAGTVLNVVSSSYKEFNANEHWFIDKCVLKRGGGTVDTWDYQLTLIRMWD
jgi:hypothetical protein